MKVLLYTEGIEQIGKSGLGKAIKHQMKALDYAKVGTTELNEMAISDFTYEQKLGSPVLVISEHEKEISDTNNAKTNATYVNSRDNSDKGDEDR